MSEASRLAARLAALARRSELLAATRGLFRQRGFVEIEAPVWVRTPGMEVHIEAVEAGDGYLSTSPELALKRLLVGGMERVFSLGKCFRAGERGVQHSVEFTMLEWYRAHASLDAVVSDTEALLVGLAGSEIALPASRGGGVIDTRTPWPRPTVRQLFDEHAGIALRGDESDEEMLVLARDAGHDIGTATAFDDIFYTVWLEAIEPAIAVERQPVLVCDWPARLAALARRRDDDPAVVERFELYIAGVELANAFGELTDPAEQRRRFEDEQAQRATRGKPVYPIDEKFLAALEEGLPPSAGIALGFDRLVMLVCGAETIGDVQAFADGEI